MRQRNDHMPMIFMIDTPASFIRDADEKASGKLATKSESTSTNEREFSAARKPSRIDSGIPSTSNPRNIAYASRIPSSNLFFFFSSSSSGSARPASIEPYV